MRNNLLYIYIYIYRNALGQLRQCQVLRSEENNIVLQGGTASDLTKQQQVVASSLQLVTTGASSWEVSSCTYNVFI